MNKKKIEISTVSLLMTTNLYRFVMEIYIYNYNPSWFLKFLIIFQQENATVAGQKVKEGVSSLLGGLTKVLTIDAEDLHKPTSPQYSGPPFFDRSKVSL